MNEPPPNKRMDFQRFSVCGLFIIALITFLYVSRSVLLPILFALILMLILRPFYGVLHRWLKLPSFLAAFVIVIGVTSAMIAGGYFLAEPAAKYLKELGDDEVQVRLKRVFSPIQEIHADIVQVAEKVDRIADEPAKNDANPEGNEVDPADVEKGTTVEIDSAKEKNEVTTTVTSPLDTKKANGTVNVQIKENSVGTFYAAMKDVGFYVLSTVVLLFFLLAYGEEMSMRLGQARGTPELLTKIEQEVSRYLFTITAINAALGTAIGLSLWYIGIPNPILWGVMAALLNFIPYAGALIGAGVVTLVSAMEFQTPGMTFAGGAVYLVLSTLEGNILTPAIIGKRFEINPIIVFIWVLAWAAIWGLPGMLIGLPLLIIFRIVCARIPSLARVERAITVRAR